MPRYRVRNLRDFQHYKGRRPPWIKWHRECLENPAFMSLPRTARWLAVLAVLVASASEDDTFSTEELEFHDRERVREGDIEKLLDSGFIEACLQDASNMLATCKHLSIPETETETETEAETEHLSRADTRRVRSYGFDECWKAYPHWERRSRKSEALEIWKRRNLADYAERVQLDIQDRRNGEDWTREEGRYVPGMQVYLRSLKDPDADLPREGEIRPAGPAVSSESGGVRWRGRQNGDGGMGEWVDDRIAKVADQMPGDYGWGYTVRAAREALEALWSDDEDARTIPVDGWEPDSGLIDRAKTLRDQYASRSVGTNR